MKGKKEEKKEVRKEGRGKKDNRMVIIYNAWEDS